MDIEVPVTAVNAIAATAPFATAGDADHHETGREKLIDVGVVMGGQADLLQIVAALTPAGGFARRLNGRQQEGDQHGDNRDDDQELDQRKTFSPTLHFLVLSN
jgi:hypothetical protein